jgi:glycosyltransferase involved in cell wall biosynthesis
MQGCKVASIRRIAVCLPSLLPIAGVERVRLSLIDEFRLLGFEVDLCLGDEPRDYRAFVRSDVRTFIFNEPQIRSFMRPFIAYLREQQPDAVIAPMWPFSCVCVLAHRLARSKSRILVSDHNPLSIQYASKGLAHRMALRLSLATTYRLAHARVAVSSGVADDVAKLSGISRRRFEVIHNPIPLPHQNRMTPAEETAAWQGWQGHRILAVGRFKEQKNYPLMLQAFATLRKTVDARLMILGVGELEQSIRQKVEQLNLTDDVIFAGQIDDPVPYYRSASVFVLSSDYEGFGNVIVEALGCELPVVSTNCPSGPAEILENGKWGRLVPMRDSPALATAIVESLLESHDTQALMRRAADFSPSIVANRYLKLLFPDSTVTQSD